MSERIVAIGAESRYPDIRGGKAMPKGSSPEISPPVGQKEFKRTTRAEIIERQVKAKERRETLVASKKETEKSAEKTQDAARRTAERVNAAPVKFVTGEKVEPVVPSKENPVIVESYPHLANQPKEVVDFLLKKAGVDAHVPEEWDKWGSVRREKWAENHGIDNTTKLPNIDESTLEAGFVHKTDVDGRDVGLYKRRGKDEYVVGNLPPREWKCETFSRIFKNAGLDIEIPISFDSLSYEDKLDFLSRLRVEVVPEAYNIMPPPARPPRFPDNTTLDAKDAYQRLTELSTELGAIGNDPSAPNDIEQDINQLFDRVSNLRPGERFAEFNDLKKSRDYEKIFGRLIEYQQLEVSLGSVDFESRGFLQERNDLFDRMRQISNHDGRINDVLDRLMRREIAGLYDEEYQVLRGYTNHITDYVRARSNDMRNYRFVFNAASSVEDFAQLQVSAGNTVALNRILRPSQRNFFRAARNRIDNHFKNVEQVNYRRAGKLGDLKKLYKNVYDQAIAFRSSIKYGSLRSMEDVEQQLFEGGVVDRASSNEPPGESGLIEWYTVNTLEEMSVQQAGENEMNVPLHWEDSLKNVKNNLRFAESGDFSQEDLGAVRQRIVQIAEGLNQRIDTLTGTEKEKAIGDLNDINEVKDAVLAIYDLRLAMQSSDMNPEEVVKHFSSHVWKDTTFQVYFKRFDKDENGSEFRGRAGKFNIQDRAMQMFFKALAEERRKLNRLEAMTIVNISTPFTPRDPRFNEMSRIMGLNRGFTPAEEASFEDLRLAMVDKMNKPALARSINDWNGFKTFKMKEGISDWYKEKTLLGAYGTHENPANPNDPNIGRQRLDMKREELLEEFKNKLKADGVSPDKVDEYERSGLLNQVMNNAYHMTWSFGAFSDYDGIRVWDRKKVWFRNSERGDVYKLGQFAFNNGTNWFNGRMVDHYAEFLQDEGRGRPDDANHVFTSHMLGKKRGILGHNRLLVKIINDNIQNHKASRDSLVVDRTGAGVTVTFTDVLTQKIKDLENVEKLEIGDRVPSREVGEYEIKDGVDYDNRWARGAAIEELLEDGDLSLENLEWSKVFTQDNENIRKFNMVDWWGDRAETHKYFGSGAMQEYLKNPGTEFFFKMNREVFYSKREIRIQPWMKIVIPAHQEIGKHWQEWWKLPYDMPHAETERVIKRAARLNMINFKHAGEMESKYVGSFPFKQLRYFVETTDRNVREFYNNDKEYVLLAPLEFFRLAGQQMMMQFAGK